MSKAFKCLNSTSRLTNISAYLKTNQIACFELLITGNVVLEKNTDLIFKKLLNVMKMLKYDDILKLSKGSNKELASLEDFSSG